MTEPTQYPAIGADLLAESEERRGLLGAVALGLALIALGLAIVREGSVQSVVEREGEARWRETKDYVAGPLRLELGSVVHEGALPERLKERQAGSDAKDPMAPWPAYARLPDGRPAGTGDPWALVGLWAAALTAMILAAVSWRAERNWKLSGGAVAIGGAALAWHFAWVAVLSVFVVMILMWLFGALVTGS